MSTKSVQIQRNPAPTPRQPGEFAPKALVANAGDNVTWHNTDNQDHWPAPSASNPTGWIQFKIPPNSESRGDVALAKNSFNVTAATNASPVVVTINGPAPVSGTSVTLAYTAPTPPLNPASPWANFKGTLVATKVGPNSCSVPLNGSTFGPWSPASGTLTVTVLLPYTLNYVCALHPDETGTITVNPQL
jgi:plastocyanin